MFLLSSDSYCRRVMLGIIYVRNMGTKIPVAAKLFHSHPICDPSKLIFIYSPIKYLRTLYCMEGIILGFL